MEASGRGNFWKVSSKSEILRHLSFRKQETAELSFPEILATRRMSGFVDGARRKTPRVSDLVGAALELFSS